ncbi:MAG TPA: integrase arm-type DNA-binding domain-containing protein [Hyphomonas sp.]|nr:integrase arm-type DNA-binding domain-containing protein [Hyphomonas sp.]HRX72721.1 integrase arm-type DNA-binding domain-containing protein [Hyphomonas sp.]
MAVTLNRLTAKQVKDAKGKGRLADGGGLWLQVTDKGAKSWLFIYRWDGKRPELGLGPYPATSLAEARRHAEEARARLAAKPRRDPRDLFKDVPEEAPQAQTFGEFTETFLDQILPDFRNEKHQQQWRNTLAAYAAKLNSMPLDTIETQHVLEVLQPIWNEKRETARRVRGRIERILDAAKAQGVRSGENPARWRGHLSAILPDQKKAKKHHPAMPFDDVPAFMDCLRADPSLSAKALEFIILTAARSSEARCAVWDEIDLDKGLWTIPPERMKANRPHRVPLTQAAIAVLKPLQEVRRGDFVFPGQSAKKSLSEAAVRKLMGKLGADAFTIHGFRSSFRDWAGERTHFPREVAEQALAHVVGDESERAYRRGDALEKRRTMMEAWAQFCEMRNAGKVVALHGK